MINTTTPTCRPTIHHAGIMPQVTFPARPAGTTKVTFSPSGSGVSSCPSMRTRHRSSGGSASTRRRSVAAAVTVPSRMALLPFSSTMCRREGSSTTVQMTVSPSTGERVRPAAFPTAASCSVLNPFIHTWLTPRSCRRSARFSGASPPPSSCTRAAKSSWKAPTGLRSAVPQPGWEESTTFHLSPSSGLVSIIRTRV